MALAALLAAAWHPAAAQRTPDGNPDLNGIWQAIGSAHWDLEAHAARHGPVEAMGALGAIPAGLSVVEGGTIPYQPWAAEKRRENLENWLKLDPAVKCYMPGIPRATYMPFPFQIVQTSEVDSLRLRIRQHEPVSSAWTGRDRRRSPLLGWGTAWAAGKRETLVVDVTAQVPDTWFDTSGNFHSEELRVEERYTSTGPNTLLYEATIVDPAVFTRPWKISMPLYPPPREERTDPRVQVRSVRRRGGVRPSPPRGPAPRRTSVRVGAGQLRRQQP